MPGFVPKLTRTPAGVDTPGPALGAHNDEIYGERLGIDAERRAALHADGVI
jgi:succinyl-CoA:(S)-malate CoA-transferase subunit B